jgi:hypothetical protein
MNKIFEKLEITPEPWIVDGWTITDSNANREKRKHIAFIPPDCIRSEGNRKLIAAAPEMLLWIFGMMECANVNDIERGAELLSLGSEIIEKVSDIPWEELNKIKD